MISDTTAIILLSLTLIVCIVVLLSLLRLRRRRRQTLRQRERQHQRKTQRRPAIPLKPSTSTSTTTPTTSSFDKDLELGKEISIDDTNIHPKPPLRPHPAHLNLPQSHQQDRTSPSSCYGLKELEAGFDLPPIPATLTSSSLSPQRGSKPSKPPRSPHSPTSSPLLSPRRDSENARRTSWRLSVMSAMSGRSRDRDAEDGRRKSRIGSFFGGGGGGRRGNKDREEVRLTYFAW